MKAGPLSAFWMNPSLERLLCLSHVSIRDRGDGTRVYMRAIGTCVQKCAGTMPVSLTFEGI